MFERVSHIGIAVKDIKASSELFRKLFNRPPDRSEDLPDHKVKTATFSVGNLGVELTQASEPESTIAKFVERHGEGMHHISFVVDDIVKELTRLKGAGFQLVDERPRLGADGFLVAFLHPKSTNGVLIEISQKNQR